MKVGAAGVQFLKIGVGARANGMAGAYGAMADDLSSIYWNPAGLADVKAIAAEFSYTEWFAGLTHTFAALSMPLGKNFTTAISVISFNSNRIPITTVEHPEGTGSEPRIIIHNNFFYPVIIFLITASATCEVPTAVGSSRVGFIS